MKGWIGLTVSQILALCGTPLDAMRFIDEPPGKLRAVEFDCRASTPPMHVVLEIDYHVALFSAQRAWSRDLVGAQTVIGIVESPVDSAPAKDAP